MMMIRTIFTSIACLIPCAFTALFAADEEEREVLLPYVTLTQPPELPKLEPAKLSGERIAEIEDLITDLAGLKSPDIGLLNNPVFNSVFLPVGEFEVFGPCIEVPFASFAPLKKLVEIGPDVLPFLLESLDSQIETKLLVQRERNFGMAFDEVLHGNPVIPAERRILELDRHLYSRSIRDDEWNVEQEMESYRVKVGDVCLAIIGQIVSRNYRSLYHPHPKDISVVICSPVHRKAVREKIRAIWSTNNPRQKVLESLLLDFSTRGVDQGDGLDIWYIGSGIQIEAVKRLLYYFPEQTSEIIAARIESFPATEEHLNDWLESGVRIDNFIDAVGWSKNEQIRAALVELAQRAKDLELIKALQRAEIKFPEK